MIISELLYKILPKKIFIKISGLYYRFNRSLYRPMSETDFINILDHLGLSEGQTVFVHSSVDKLNIGFPYVKLLWLLQKRVGPNGTLLFPSWNYNGRTEEYLKSGAIYNVKKSYTLMGLLPELARRKKQAVRSLHPTASIAAIGKHAVELAEDHHLSEYPCDENSPYYKLMNHDSIIIGLGEKTVSLSFLHCIEDVMKESFPVGIYHPEKFKAKMIDYAEQEREMWVFVHHSNNQYHSIPEFMNKYVSKEACRDMRIKGRNFFVADPVKLFKEMTALAKKGITIYKQTKPLQASNKLA